MPPEPELSVIIASWNSWGFLDPCLDSLAGAGVDRLETLVVDNASADGTLGFLARKYPDVRVLANTTNRGHCRAINQGIAAARGEYLMVLDADTVLRPDSAARLIEFLRSRSDVAIAAPRMLNPDGSIQETARSFPGVMNGIFGRQSRLTRWFPKNRHVRRYMRSETVEATEPFEVDWVSAACMVFPRRVPARVGLWDEGYAGYWVDADWCLMAHREGKVFCVPESQVVHFEQNRSGRKKGARRILMFHAGAHRFFRKQHRTGILDPRSVAAGLGLGLRAAALVVADALRRSSEAEPSNPKAFRLEE